MPDLSLWYPAAWMGNATRGPVQIQHSFGNKVVSSVPYGFVWPNAERIGSSIDFHISSSTRKRPFSFAQSHFLLRLTIEELVLPGSSVSEIEPLRTIKASQRDAILTITMVCPYDSAILQLS